jgi:hypothetical protein
MPRNCHLKLRILAQGLYLIWILDAKTKTKEINGVISILESEATPDKLDKELKNQISNKWNFKVKQISSTDYLASFLAEP